MSSFRQMIICGSEAPKLIRYLLATVYTGLNQTWAIGRLSIITRRYVGKREGKITTEYEKLLSLLCFVNEFTKTKRRKYPQYTSE